MKVLVAGGSGVVGRSAITALLKRGHRVRLLSRGAAEDVKDWPDGVEPWPGDVGTAASIEGCAAGCDAVLHLVGVVQESPPDRTFQRINIDGTRWVVLEAEKSGCVRFVFVSSLGAATGKSAYHKSKCVAEEVVRGFSREWVILRPGPVYGPGDEHLSVMLRMVRTMPVVPSIGDGRQLLQPLWHEDLASCLAIAIDKPGLAGRVLDVAGLETTSQEHLVDRMQALAGRRVPKIDVPDFFASLGVRAIEALGIQPPVSESQLDMLREGHVVADGRPNALVEDFGVVPIPLADGLRRFISEQPVQLPDEGVGALARKSFLGKILTTAHDADSLFAYLREHLLDLMPSLVDSNPEDNNPSRIVEGDTLTLAVPVRGHMQVRVAEVADRRITLLTLQGHPLAGAVRFILATIPGGVSFEVQVYDRPANLVDWVLMRPLGDRAQEVTWRELVRTVARVAGAGDVQVEEASRDLTEEEAKAVERWARDLASRGRRAGAAADIAAAEASP